ncbi:hypothetical protein GQ44DRAFT_731965 [Phaeosphaeriaceae sp. PMI808]|nr:hypothetical protein GQ44DRAFT_731965 [Phaeosphaeriaceae sp. PMI808]
MPIFDFFERHVAKALMDVKGYMNTQSVAKLTTGKKCSSITTYPIVGHILVHQKDIVNAFRADIEEDLKASSNDTDADENTASQPGVFSIVTILFAPLAFPTVLFALKVQGFERLMITNNSDGRNADASESGRNYNSGKMAGILISSVLATFILTGFLVFGSMKWLNIDLKVTCLNGSSRRLGSNGVDSKRRNGKA